MHVIILILAIILAIALEWSNSRTIKLSYMSGLWKSGNISLNISDKVGNFRNISDGKRSSTVYEMFSSKTLFGSDNVSVKWGSMDPYIHVILGEKTKVNEFGPPIKIMYDITLTLDRTMIIYKEGTETPVIILKRSC